MRAPRCRRADARLCCFLARAGGRFREWESRHISVVGEWLVLEQRNSLLNLGRVDFEVRHFCLSIWQLVTDCIQPYL
jgi:hypothetical protein